MTIRAVLVEGIRRTDRSMIVVLVLFGVNFLLAGIGAMVFQSVISSSFDHSLAPMNFIRDFDFTVYSDFLTKNQGKLHPVYGMMMWFVVLSNFISVFLDGGIIASVLPDAEPFRVPSFCASCGEFFGRFLRLFVMVILAWLILGAVMMVLCMLVFSAVIGSGETEIQLLEGLVTAAALFLLPMSMILLASDYARVITVADGERRMFRAFWHGFLFVIKKIHKVFIIFLFWFLLFLILLGCWIALTTQIVVDSGFMVLGIFIIQQLVTIGRSWVRVASIGCEVLLYLGTKSVVQELQPSIQEMPIVKEEVLPPPLMIPEEVIEKKPAQAAKKRARPFRSRRRTKLNRTKRTMKRPSSRTKK